MEVCFCNQAAEEARRNRLMRDMAQLRLQVGDAGSSLKIGRVVAEMSETRKGRGSSLLPSHTEAISPFCKDRIIEYLKLERTHRDHQAQLPAPRRAI